MDKGFNPLPGARWPTYNKLQNIRKNKTDGGTNKHVKWLLTGRKRLVTHNLNPMMLALNEIRVNASNCYGCHWSYS